MLPTQWKEKENRGNDLEIGWKRNDTGRKVEYMRTMVVATEWKRGRAWRWRQQQASCVLCEAMVWCGVGKLGMNEGRRPRWWHGRLWKCWCFSQLGPRHDDEDEECVCLSSHTEVGLGNYASHHNTGREAREQAGHRAVSEGIPLNKFPLQSRYPLS